MNVQHHVYLFSYRRKVAIFPHEGRQCGHGSVCLMCLCPEDLQRALDILKIYCEFWGLDINVSKTKVMIFSRGKIRKMPKFNFNEETVDVVWDYKYLGVKFNYNNQFKKAQQLQFLLANRAMFELLRKCRQLNLPLDIQIELFEKCVHPIQSTSMVVKYGRARRWM